MWFDVEMLIVLKSNNWLPKYDLVGECQITCHIITFKDAKAIEFHIALILLVCIECQKYIKQV